MMPATCPACADAHAKPLGRKLGNLAVVQCDACGLVFTDPLPRGGANDVGASSSSVTDEGYYQNIIADHAAQESLAAIKVRRLVNEYERSFGISPKRVLEIGCGTGQFSDAWAGVGATWLGIETSPMMLKFCMRHGKPVLDSAEIATLPEHSFDLIYFSQVLEHVLDPRPFLDQVRRLLAEGGIVHLDVPNHDSLISRIRRANPWSGEFGFIQPPHHLIAYRARSLRDLLDSNGFFVLEIRAFANDHPVYGQLIVAPRMLHRLVMKVDSLLGTGSLLVCIARTGKAEATRG